MLFSDDWSENVALFERLMEIYSNPPILYYGFNMLFLNSSWLRLLMKYETRIIEYNTRII